MKGAKSGSSQFFIAFFMGIFILALPFSYALFKFAGNKIVVSQESSESYYPQSSDSILLTIALKNNERDKPNCFVLCGIYPLSDTIKFAVLPPETMVEDAGKFDAAASVWKRDGEERAMAAICGVIGAGEGKWLEFDSQAIVKLGEVTGAIDFTLSEAVSLEDGLMVLPAKRQLIDGTRAALLLNYTGYSEGEQQRLEITRELIYQMLIQRMPLMTEELLIKTFETAVNNGASNLVIADFETRRRVLVHLFSRDFKVEGIAVNGEYNDAKNTFLLSAQSASDLKTAFSA